MRVILLFRNWNLQRLDGIIFRLGRRLIAWIFEPVWKTNWRAFKLWDSSCLGGRLLPKHPLLYSRGGIADGGWLITMPWSCSGFLLTSQRRMEAARAVYKIPAEKSMLRYEWASHDVPYLIVVLDSPLAPHSNSKLLQEKQTSIKPHC